MAKVKNTFSRLGRALSTSHYDPPTSGSKKRTRTISEILDTEHAHPIHAHPGGLSPMGEFLLLVYHGYTCVDEPRSSKDVLSALRSIREVPLSSKQVSVSYNNGTLRVAEGNGEAILVCPLHSMTTVIHDASKGGFTDCLAISFGTGHYAKQCHTFQAKSSREAADTVQILQRCLRNASKDLKLRKTESGSSMSSMVEGPKVRSQLGLMEDEDEVIEHKTLTAYNGGRRDSKRAIPAVLHTDITTSLSGPNPQQPNNVPPSDSSSSAHHQPLSGPLTHKRKSGQRKTGGVRGSGGDHGEFKRRYKMDQLLGAIKGLQDNNTLLREQAKRVLTPHNVFEDSLVAMAGANPSLLSHYMSLGNVSNSHDSFGNTLLHYAVAFGQPQSVSILCSKNASLEASGWNDCKPIHRAVAEGNKNILQILLHNMAEVNSLDLMRHTPLHFSSAQNELMECTICLLEFGAHIMDSDILGLRPFDLNPELKETLNRLVTSACETFVSSPLTTGETHSPSSSQPNSILDNRLHNLWGMDNHDGNLAHTMDKVNFSARAITSHAHRKKSIPQGQPHSRSHGNLVELQEVDEEEKLGRDRLKYPSDYAVDLPYFEVLQSTDKAMRDLMTLMHTSKAINTNVGVVGEGQVEGLIMNKLEVSLSEPDLHIVPDEECISVEDNGPQPHSSTAVVQEQRLMTLLGGKVTKFRTDSGSSTGTLREEDTDSDIIQMSKEDFNDHQDNLGERNHSEDGLDEIGVTFAHKPLLTESPQTSRRVLAVFDDIPFQMEADSNTMPSESSPQSYSGIKLKIDELPRRRGSANLYTSSSNHIDLEVRPSSSAGFNRKEVEPSDDPVPRAASVEAELFFGTLPEKKKKKKGKWPGIMKISSPLFLRNRRKSFSLGPNPSLPSIACTSISNHMPSSPAPIASHESIVSSHYSLHETPPPVEVSSTHRNEETDSKGSHPVSNDIGERLASSTPQRSNGMGSLGKRGRGRNECLNALRMMTMLSSNSECVSVLSSYICLPKCISKLIETAQSPSTSLKTLSLISSLLSNLYKSRGPEGKITPLGSGILDLTIKLLQSRDPLPTTCLTLLNNILIGDDESDCLRTIIRIPTAPLLQYLESFDQSGSDSGIENSSRHSGGHTVVSTETKCSSDTTSTATDEGVGGESLLALPTPNGNRCSSFHSETSESSSGQSILSPTLALQNGSPPMPTSGIVPGLSPRRIVLKMLAISSTHSKMQVALSTNKALTLLMDHTSDPSRENVVNTLVTLANIAQNVSSHGKFQQLGLAERLQSLLTHGPRQRYLATRTLVYMGKLHLLAGCGLFDGIAAEYESDMYITAVDGDGHTYARGATIEKCIELLISDPSQLWGGFSLMVGPHAQDHPPFSVLHASKDQVLQFFLTMYKSFAHPLILIRLLLHRLSLKDTLNLFDWSKDSSSFSNSSTTHLASIPSMQINILNLIGRWLETFPDDFVECMELKKEVERLLGHLKMAAGPYLPHSNKLRSLLQNVDRPKAEEADVTLQPEARPPHHENLYKLCQLMVTGGHLPVTLHQAIYMASLHLHIDLISSGREDFQGLNFRSKRGTVRLRSVFPPGFSKSKNIIKRVEVQMLEFEKLSIRNAKHLYIERCQANPGYDCSFFNVRVPSSGRFKRAPVAKQLMGISNKRILFLDEKTKEFISGHSMQSVSSIMRESDPCVLLINLRGDSAGFKVHVDSPTVAKEMANILEERREGEALFDDHLRLSESVPSLFTMSMEHEVITLDTDSSISTTDRTPTDQETLASAGHVLSSDIILNHSPDVGVVGTALTPPNGNMETLFCPKSDTLHALSHNDSLTNDADFLLPVSDKEKLLFCDCPPDPEILPEVNLNDLTLEDILMSPMEVARQMTIIDHKRFCNLTSKELLQKVHLISKPSSTQRDSIASTATLQATALTDADLGETAVEKLASRFNQVGNWVTHSILQYEFIEERVAVVQQFISIAKHCLELGNFSSVMAIVVAGLSSAPVRRLQQTWALLHKVHEDTFKDMCILLESQSNYKHYRDKLSATEVPAVPYVGVFLKDLTFLCDGNPDYLRGGLINLHKRRQVYKLLEEIKHYQKDAYKLHPVPELQHYLLTHQLCPEDDLHTTSHNLEPRGIRRSHSSSSTKSLSSTQGRSFFRGLTRTSSASTANRASAASAV